MIYKNLAFPILFLAFSWVLTESAQSESLGCSDQPIITDAANFQGVGSLTVNKQDTVLLALDVSRDSAADVLFRIGMNRADPTIHDLAESIGHDSELIVSQRWGQDYHELKITGYDGEPEAMLFILDRRACAEDAGVYEGIAATARTRARAIIRETSLEAGQSPSQLLTERGDEAAVLRASVLDSDKRTAKDEATLFEPLFCAAGGEGATACSIDAGGISPGGCSVQCDPPLYACCRPAFGSDCNCLQPDTTTPGEPDGVVSGTD